MARGKFGSPLILARVSDLDDWLVIQANTYVRAHHVAGNVASFIASWSAGLEVGLLGVLWLAGFQRAVGRTLGAVVVIYAIAEVVGQLVPRTRPFARLDHVRGSVGHDPGRSFPSRHVASAFAMATVAAKEQPLIGAAMGGTAWALAGSRVFVGVHYPSDVVSGAVLGVLVGSAVRRRGPRE